ncbi:MAG: xanthine dehydrogenase family protein subunit M [Candidatus Binatia bacterium]
MISKEFSFHAPKSLNDAFGLLERHGDDAKVLAGGMSLMPVMTLGLLQPEVVISLNHVPGLDYVREDGDKLRIGALTRHHTVLNDPLIKKHCPVLSEAAALIGDVQVRHRGTIGGSLAHADPAADYIPVMLVTNAQFKLQSSKGERTVKATDFFKDLMQTALKAGELLTEIEIPKAPAGSGSAYVRLHRVEGNFAIVAAAAVIDSGFKSARVAIGGVGPKAVLMDVSKRLAKGVNDEALRGVSDDAYAASGEAYGDLNGDATYRRAMARVYAQRAVRAAASRM